MLIVPAETKFCLVCNTPQNLHRHRIIPGKVGGDYSWYNVVIVCQIHHTKIHTAIRLLGPVTFEGYFGCVQKVINDYKVEEFSKSVEKPIKKLDKPVKVKKLPFGIPRQLDINQR